jgi:hypothetical protein
MAAGPWRRQCSERPRARPRHGIERGSHGELGGGFTGGGDVEERRRNRSRRGRARFGLPGDGAGGCRAAAARATRRAAVAAGHRRALGHAHVGSASLFMGTRAGPVRGGGGHACLGRWALAGQAAGPERVGPSGSARSR